MPSGKGWWSALLRSSRGVPKILATWRARSPEVTSPRAKMQVLSPTRGCLKLLRCAWKRHDKGFAVDEDAPDIVSVQPPALADVALGRGCPVGPGRCT